MAGRCSRRRRLGLDLQPLVGRADRHADEPQEALLTEQVEGEGRRVAEGHWSVVPAASDRQLRARVARRRHHLTAARGPRLRCVRSARAACRTRRGARGGSTTPARPAGCRRPRGLPSARPVRPPCRPTASMPQPARLTTTIMSPIRLYAPVSLGRCSRSPARLRRPPEQHRPRLLQKAGPVRRGWSPRSSVGLLYRRLGG